MGTFSLAQSRGFPVAMPSICTATLLFEQSVCLVYVAARSESRQAQAPTNEGAVEFSVLELRYRGAGFPGRSRLSLNRWLDRISD